LGEGFPNARQKPFNNKVAEHLPGELTSALEPILETIASLTEHIKDYDRKLEDVAEELYPQTKLLRQVHGVGVLTALAFVLTLEDPTRFAKSREVGAYLGLVPATDQSGGSDPEKHISKHGNKMMRKLLVSSAHYILGPFGEDCDLRRHGEKIAQRGGKNAKKSGRLPFATISYLLLLPLHSAFPSIAMYAAKGWSDDRNGRVA
jgi:transposase